jgi:hypothetical protein
VAAVLEFLLEVGAAVIGIGIIAAAVVVVASLTLAAVQTWVADHTVVTSSYAELIRRQLADGRYEVVAGVFNRDGTRTASRTWRADRLDDGLRQRLGDGDRVKIWC